VRSPTQPDLTVPDIARLVRTGLNAEVTSAVELDEELVNSIGERIEEQTGRRVELSSKIDPDVLGGLQVRVGNMVLDATVRNRLEQLRKQVARAAA
jgi:ATP synthase F1 delta subunit